jgi:hypothetical protein
MVPIMVPIMVPVTAHGHCPPQADSFVSGVTETEWKMGLWSMQGVWSESDRNENTNRVTVTPASLT